MEPEWWSFRAVPWIPGTQGGWGGVRTPDKVGRKQASGQGFWAS